MVQNEILYNNETQTTWTLPKARIRWEEKKTDTKEGILYGITYTKVFKKLKIVFKNLSSSNWPMLGKSEQGLWLKYGSERALLGAMMFLVLWEA